MDLSKALADFASWIWGPPLLIYLLIANIILLKFSKLVPIKGFMHSIRLLAKKEDANSNHEGQITHFQALCNALAATIGLGNIAGVAVAINTGGAGAIFWMWIAAILGMNTKFFECTLSIMYRGKDNTGEVQGGPMYVIDQYKDGKYKFLAVFFSICGIIGTLSLFQINQLTEYIHINFSINKIIIGGIISALIFYILIGGLKRITNAAEKLVPIMSIGYFIVCIIILVMNISDIPQIFIQIFKEAFMGKAAVGGAAGYAVMRVISIGVKRATFSNEAGVGTAPMAHSNAKTNEPISEGYVAMLGPFFDTIIVCTMTALVILVSTNNGDVSNGIELTNNAFKQNFGTFGVYILGIMVFLFSFTTMIGMANYNKKCWDYLLKGKWGFNNTKFVIFYCVSIFIGAQIKLNDVINLMDIAYALMALPNIFITIALAGKVKSALKEYNQKYNL